MAKNFLERYSPNRERTKTIAWPFPVEGETPKVRMRVLGSCDYEAAFVAAGDHFRAQKAKVAEDSPAFSVRERTELVWRAFADAETGKPLADTADELAKEAPEVVAPLFLLWNDFQSQAGKAPASSDELKKLVEELKKNTLSVRLLELPSTSLIELISILVSQPDSSTQASERG